MLSRGPRRCHVRAGVRGSISGRGTRPAHPVNRAAAPARGDARSWRPGTAGRRSSTRCAPKRRRCANGWQRRRGRSRPTKRATMSRRSSSAASRRAWPSAHAPSLVAVINATGVIIHTNLGRAPLAAAATARVAALASGYTNLEYDLATGTADGATSHAERLLCRLTGAEAAVVVNNNAAATLLSLAALAAGREVVISRGELVEIGGGFRVPDVMAQSGAILREVGTTNRTRASDYAAAISRSHGAHPARAPLELHDRRLHRAARRRRARRARPPLQHSGGRRPGQRVPRLLHRRRGARDEPSVADSLSAGVEPRDVQRRQAPRRTAGGHHRRHERGASAASAGTR